jgi:tetratricopeptide (TPR) repeat protein
MCSSRSVLLALLCASFAAKSLTAAEPASQCSTAEIFNNVNSLLAKRDYRAASEQLDSLRSCHNLSDLERFQTGWLYGRARSFQKAIDFFQSVPATVPDRSTHDYALALSQFELADYRAAANTLQSAASTYALDGNAANLLAVAYSKQGLFQQAYAVLHKQVEQQQPADVNTYLNLVTVCADGGDLTRAVEVASAAVERFPNSPDAVAVLGAAYSLQGNFDKARQTFLVAERLAPQRADVRFFLALTSYNQSRFLDAIATLETAFKDGIQDSDLHYLMAECLIKLNKNDSSEALNQLNEAIRLWPASVPARTLRGRLLLDSDQTLAAITDLESAHAADPAARSTIYVLARAYRKVGRGEQAASLFAQLHSTSPDILKEASERRLSDRLTGKSPSP